MLVSWGVILGISWTYGDMFGVFLNDTKLSHKQVAMVGLFANLSTVIFSNLGNFISNLFNFSNHFVIFNLNIVGFMASLVILASTTIEHELFQNKLTIIVMIIILKAGFGSFVSLALNQLSHCGPSLLVSSIFFYIANISNLGGNYLVGKLLNS